MTVLPVEISLSGAVAHLSNCSKCHLPVLQWKDNATPSKEDLRNAQKVLSKTLKEDVVIRKGGTDGNYYVLLQSLFR